MTPHSMTASGALSMVRELLGGQMIVAMTGYVMVHLTIQLAPIRLLIRLFRTLIQGTHLTLTILNNMAMTIAHVLFQNLSFNHIKSRLRNRCLRAPAK